MTTPLLAGLATRSRQLADQLVELRARVREAVAAELGRVVADAVRDLLTAALRGRSPDSERPTYRRPGPVRTDPWDDDTDDWGQDGEDDYRHDPGDPGGHLSPGPATDNPRSSTPWATALSAGIVATRWLLARRLRTWPCVVVGVAVSALALAGGHAERAVFAAVATALELACLTQSGPD